MTVVLATSWASSATAAPDASAPDAVTPEAASPEQGSREPSRAELADAGTSGDAESTSAPIPDRKAPQTAVTASSLRVAEATSMAESMEALDQLSLEDMLEFKVTVASKTEMKASEAPSIVTVIPRAEIVSLGYRTIGDALRSVPGFFVTDDLLTANVAVRGVHGGPDSWSPVIKVMVNGHATTYHSTGGNFLGPEFLPIDVVEAIEVIRGTGSALYGANALLAVVNVITRRPDDPGTRVEGTGEAGTVNGNAAWSSGVHGSVALGGRGQSYVMASARAEHTDRSGLGVPGGSPNQTYGGTLSTGDISRPKSVFSRGVFDLDKLGTLEAQYQLQEVDAFGEFSSVSVLTHKNRIAMRNNVLGLDYRHAFLSDDLKLHAYATYSTGSQLPRERLDVGSTGYYYRRDRSYQRTLGGIEASYTRWRHEILAGFEYANLEDSGDRLYAVALDPQTGDSGNLSLRYAGQKIQVLDYAVFGQLVARVPVTGLVLTAGGRYAWNETWQNAFNYRLAAAYTLSKALRAKAVFGTSFLPPAPAQLQSSPLEFGRGLVGNPGLHSQKATTGELEVSFDHRRLFEVSANAFYSEINDRVEFFFTGNQLNARNIAASRTFGIEASGRLSLAPFFAAGNLSYQHTKPSDAPDNPPYWWQLVYDQRANGTGGDRSLYFPSWMAYAYAGVRQPAYFFEAYLSARYVGSRKSSMQNIMTNQQSYLLPSYTLLGITVKTMELKLARGWTATASLLVDNVFDRRSSEGGYYGVDIPNVGRSVYLRLSMAFF